MAALFVYLCKNCGKTIDYTQSEAETAECSCKHTDYIYLGVNPVQYYKMSDSSKDRLIQKKLKLTQNQFEELKVEWSKIRKEVDSKYYAQRLEQRNEQRRVSQNTPKCPTCGSTNIEKISTTKKAIGFVAVGVFSSNFGKTMHCKQCGYKW